MVRVVARADDGCQGVAEAREVALRRLSLQIDAIVRSAPSP
jgi:hypothetical protein